jgi:hypothetical protein
MLVLADSLVIELIERFSYIVDFIFIRKDIHTTTSSIFVAFYRRFLQGRGCSRRIFGSKRS